MSDEKLKLLVRYIAWVIANEGIDYITQGGGHGGAIQSNFFDDDEWFLLHELAAKAREYEG